MTTPTPPGPPDRSSHDSLRNRRRRRPWWVLALAALALGGALVMALSQCGNASSKASLAATSGPAAARPAAPGTTG